jgi:hypothetical protein
MSRQREDLHGRAGGATDTGQPCEWSGMAPICGQASAHSASHSIDATALRTKCGLLWNEGNP